MRRVIITIFIGVLLTIVGCNKPVEVQPEVVPTVAPADTPVQQ